jgi:hypothetical protein
MEETKIKQLLLKENPDSGTLNGKLYIWSVNSVSFFLTEDGRSSITFPSFIKYTHYDVLNEILTQLDRCNYPDCSVEDIKLSNSIEIVGDKAQLFSTIYNNMGEILGDDPEDDELTHYRRIFITGRYWEKLKLICVWDDFRSMPHAKRVELIDFMIEEQLDPEQFMFGDKGKGHITYSQFIGGFSTAENNKDFDIRKIKHVMDPMVKQLLKTKNSTLTPNDQQKLADKMGITQVELKKILGGNGD